MTIDFAPLKYVILQVANTETDPGQSNRIKAIARTLEEFWDHYSNGLAACELMLAFANLGRLSGPHTANDDGRVKSRRNTCEQISSWISIAYPEVADQTDRVDYAKWARNWLAVAQSIDLFSADNRQKAIAATAMREAQEFLSLNEDFTAWREFESMDALEENTTYEFLIDCGTRFFGRVRVYNAGEADQSLQLEDTWGDHMGFEDDCENVTHYRIPADFPADN